MSKQRNDAFKDLQKIISEKSRPFAFWTGAGVSAPKLPNWKSLLDSVIKVAKQKSSEISDNKNIQATIKAAETEKDLWRSFERLVSAEQGIGPESFRAIILEKLEPSGSLEIPEIQKILWHLAPKGIVTLNLDLFTQRSASELGSIIPIQITPTQFGKNFSVFKEIRPFIAYPHGILDDFNSWTFTSTVLSRRLEDEQYQTWVTSLLSSHVVVFIGITADDLAVGGLMDKLKNKSGGEFKGNFWITSRNDSATYAWAEERGIRVIPYDVNGEDHSDLLNLLKEIKQYRPVESTILEAPIVANFKQFTPLENLPPPDEIDLKDKEKIRHILNIHTNNIFSKYSNDPAKRDKEFREFLLIYEDAIHNAYYTSVSPGKNQFFGYLLQGRADGGAFGNVYHAIDNDGNSVAIKILHSDKLNDPDFYRNFRRGVNSLKILSERNVDGIVGYKKAAEIPPSLIMEWIDGATLNNAIHSSNVFDWNYRFRLLLRLTNILSHSHSLPERVLHRDLRPANIMIRDFYSTPETLDVVVLDFDLSWHKGAEDHSVMYSPAMGYLAPEQRRRIPKVSTKSTLVDSYGFGMVAYFIVSKEDPIPDQHMSFNWKEKLNELTKTQPFKPLICGPKRLMRIIEKCTLENQHQRMQISQAQGELQSIIDFLDKPDELSSTSLIAEELAARTEHMSGYEWNDEKSSANLQISAEKATSLKADVAEQRIFIRIDWMNTGTQDWSQINRLIDRDFPKMLNLLTTAGWKCTHTKQSRSFYVEAWIDANEIIQNITDHASKLDKALASLSSTAGY